MKNTSAQSKTVRCTSHEESLIRRLRAIESLYEGELGPRPLADRLEEAMFAAFADRRSALGGWFDSLKKK